MKYWHVLFGLVGGLWIPQLSFAVERPPVRSSSKVIRINLPQRVAPYKVNTLLGINIAQGSGLVSGFQIGKAISKTTPLYAAAEANFSLFSPGSMLAIMGGGWYEFSPFSSPQVSIALGLVGGPGFTTQLSGFSPTPFVAFFDAALAQELDDLARMRVQLRPGVIGKHFAFMMNFNISFSIS